MKSEWTYLSTVQARFPELVAHLLKFNYQPAAYLHPERRSSLLPGVPGSVWSMIRIHGRLSDRILRQSNILEHPAFIFPHWGWQLALLPPHGIERLSLHLSALVNGIRIRTSLSRASVLSWKARLGAEAYEFSMTRASLLPQVKDCGTDLLSLPPDKCGYWLLHCASSDMPEAMRIRFQWKMPIVSEGPEVELPQARKLVRTVLSIVEPEWHSFSLPIAK